MDWQVILTCVLIVLARIADVSLGTLRTVCVIYGRRGASWILGFFEVLIWIFVVSRVITQAQQEPLYAVFYAIGFATGNFIGITIEQRLAYGQQVVRVFTRQGHAVAEALRNLNFRVTELDGRGREGPVSVLFIGTERKRSPLIIRTARSIDAQCFYVIDDVRISSAANIPTAAPDAPTAHPGSPQHWDSPMKRK